MSREELGAIKLIAGLNDPDMLKMFDWQKIKAEAQKVPGLMETLATGKLPWED